MEDSDDKITNVVHNDVSNTKFAQIFEPRRMPTLWWKYFKRRQNTTATAMIDT